MDHRYSCCNHSVRHHNRKHCSGAAKIAFERFGAKIGVGLGIQGQSYAIPTMQGGLKSIEAFVQVLAGYYHSRIEYPDQADPSDSDKKTENKAEKKVEIIEDSQGGKNAK